MKKDQMRVAFIVDVFPTFTPFIIDQVAGLLDAGLDVRVFTFQRAPVTSNISDKYLTHNMADVVRSLDFPSSLVRRIIVALPMIGTLLLKNPKVLFRSMNVFRYGMHALSLKLLYRVYPFTQTNDFDLYHCHFGKTANDFLNIREALGIYDKKFITTFYGFDVSQVFRTKPKMYYDRLKRECDGFLVMSEYMKIRVVTEGFDSKKITVLPVGIDVRRYPFRERSLEKPRPIRVASAGRFVEKKGFDDLLRALAIIRKSGRTFVCEIVGGGALEDDLKKLTQELDLRDCVRYLGYKKVEDLIPWLLEQDVFVQPSKTARDGDME